ncbi:uncharacterized protein [Euwallacea fornicatus]|uniref:uncharacterized protein n=1 Tax=Euwallacea fornicatus TaxID=995702 RepID=UPI00338E3A09
MEMLDTAQNIACATEKTRAPPPAPPEGPEEITTTNFGWEEIEGQEPLPYVIRDSGNYVAFSSFIRKLLPDVFRYLNSKTLTDLIQEDLVGMTALEAHSFNVINREHCEGMLVGPKYCFQPGENMMSLGDFKVCLDFFQTCYALVRFQKVKNELFGFLQISGGTSVPFVHSEGQRLTPLFYFDGQYDSLSSTLVDLKDKWKMRCLKFCCIAQAIRKELYDFSSLRVANVDCLMALLPGETATLHWPQDFNRQDILSPEVNIAALHGAPLSPGLLTPSPVNSVKKRVKDWTLEQAAANKRAHSIPTLNLYVTTKRPACESACSSTQVLPGGAVITPYAVNEETEQASFETSRTEQLSVYAGSHHPQVSASGVTIEKLLDGLKALRRPRCSVSGVKTYPLLQNRNVTNCPYAQETVHNMTNNLPVSHVMQPQDVITNVPHASPRAAKSPEFRILSPRIHGAAGTGNVISPVQSPSQNYNPAQSPFEINPIHWGRQHVPSQSMKIPNQPPPPYPTNYYPANTQPSQSLSSPISAFNRNLLHYNVRAYFNQNINCVTKNIDEVAWDFFAFFKVPLVERWHLHSQVVSIFRNLCQQYNQRCSSMQSGAVICHQTQQTGTCNNVPLKVMEHSNMDYPYVTKRCKITYDLVIWGISSSNVITSSFLVNYSDLEARCASKNIMNELNLQTFRNVYRLNAKQKAQWNELFRRDKTFYSKSYRDLFVEFDEVIYKLQHANLIKKCTVTENIK